MDSQVPNSQIPGPEMQQEAVVQTPFLDVEAMKAQARELAIQQVMASRAMSVAPSAPQQAAPKVIYVRRNLTIAELIVMFAITWGIVAGIPALWNFASNRLPQIEIKVKQ